MTVAQIDVSIKGAIGVLIIVQFSYAISDVETKSLSVPNQRYSSFFICVLFRYL